MIVPRHVAQYITCQSHTKQLATFGPALARQTHAVGTPNARRRHAKRTPSARRTLRSFLRKLCSVISCAVKPLSVSSQDKQNDYGLLRCGKRKGRSSYPPPAGMVTFLPHVVSVVPFSTVPLPTCKPFDITNSFYECVLGTCEYTLYECLHMGS